MMFNRKTRNGLLAGLLLPCCVHSQFDDSSFARYTVKDGLSSNYITTLQQDELGYLWVGTTMGVNRFDGLNFKNFARDEHVRLPTGDIARIKKLEKEKLHIVSRRGLHALNTRNLSFQHFFIPDSTLLNYYRNSGWDVAVLPGNSLALTTATGFYVFGPGGEIVFRHDAFSMSDYGKRILYGRDLLQVSDNDLLIYIHNNGLAHYNITRKSFYEVPLQERQWDAFRILSADSAEAHSFPQKISPTEFLFFYLQQDSIAYYNYAQKRLVKSPLPFASQRQLSWESHIVRCNDSLFVINSSNGGFYTFLLDPKTGQIRFNPEKFLPAHSIIVMYIDHEKRLWAGTRNGLLRQRTRDNFLQAQYYPPAPGDLSVLGFQSAYRYQDKLYVSRFSRTNGLVVIDTATRNVIKRLEFFGGNNSWNEVASIIMYHPDTLWLGTNGGPLWLDTKTYHYGKLFEPVKYPMLKKTVVHFSPVNKDGYAWFLFFLEGIVCRYQVASRQFRFFTAKTDPAFPFQKIKSIVYDSYGDVWFGGHALARWSTRKEKFDTLIRVYGGANKYNDDILMMAADNHGSLWIHNTENDLLEYRVREKEFVSYTVKDGLPSSVFSSFSPVVNDVLWIGGANNLTRFDIKTKKSFVYDHNDGFPDESPVGARRIIYDPAGTFYFFCRDFIVRFPADAKQKSIPPGNLLIQELRVNENKSWYHPEGVLKLRHNENNINLLFNIIEFESPNSYQLSYRIDDDRDWTVSGASRSLRMKGMTPGKHTIALRAIGKNGEQKQKQLSIIIGKPFWKTTTFLLSAGLLLTVFFIYRYRRRLRLIHQKANIDKLIAQTQMKALHAQMNPHFVFNSLNSIREMILNNENKEASHFLSKFAQLMRMTLDQSVETFVSLRNTMEYLERYMEMEQIRNEHFTCRILADEDLDPDETLLPPMLIQPFIENAIWHGVSGTRKDININIDFRKDGEQLVCIIDDNGMGINQSLSSKANSVGTHTSVGIDNIRNRVQLLNEKYGLTCSVEIMDKNTLPGNGNGTRVTIRLPLQINE